MILTHKTVSLADQVFDRLESDILSGVYKRGEILTELKLCEALGVSRTPVREAMKRLEQEHIIYPKCVQLYCEGRLKVEGRHVHIL